MALNLDKRAIRRIIICGVFFALLAALYGPLTIKYETGPTAIFKFRAGSPEDLSRCPPKTEKDWYKAEFEAEGYHYEFVSPLGLICGKDASGRYMRVYVSEGAHATHRLELGSTKNFIEQPPTFQALTR
ncbi:hypothetical protein WBQ88_12245 [Sphingopyxis sp. CCNWLW253]|uniref:hypothetical protein n=1 Tax=unclassified Sphingopyxis TaxID=2614943 RepID=UPI003012FEC8